MEKIEAKLSDIEQLGQVDEDNTPRLTVEEVQNLQAADEEALEAVGKVAHVAQSSLRRLQQVVKEKDELIAVLQDAVGSAYKSGVDKHETEQHDLRLLHKLLLAEEDRSIQSITKTLQFRSQSVAVQTVTNQQPSPRNSLAAQLSRMFDQYLNEIAIKHEQEIEPLQRRCQELEDCMDHEKKNAKDEQERICTNTKTELEKSMGVIQELNRELNSKNEQLLVYENTVRELESLLEEEKAREKELSLEHGKLCEETRQSLGQVSSVGQQLQKLKDQTQKVQQQEQENEYQLMALRDKVSSQKSLIYKLGVQLAALRKKTKVIEPLSTVVKAGEGGSETRKQTQYLQDCIQKLRAQVFLLEGEVRQARVDNEDSDSRYTQEIIVTDETRICSPADLTDQPFSTSSIDGLRKRGNHDKLVKRVEALQRNLKAAKEESEKRRMDVDVKGATIEQLRLELRKSKETVRRLQARKRKKVDTEQQKATDCVRIKGLLENTEALEMENAVLKHEVNVQQSRRIAKLERDLQRVQGYNLTFDTRLGEHGRHSTRADETTSSSIDNALEDVLAKKEAVILELKFESDQASWKLAQVEKKFRILFGALECKRLELDVPVADTLLEDIFESETGELSIPALTLLREKVLHQRGFLRSGSRERELQDLVDALTKVLEKLSGENEVLKQSCEESVRHMEKSRKLRKVMDDMQNQRVQGSGQIQNDYEQKVKLINDLRSKLHDLTEANAGLLKALRESEGTISVLRQTVHDQQMKQRKMISGMTLQTSMSAEESFGILDPKEILTRMDVKIQKLESQLLLRDGEISQLTAELEEKDDELDLLHGTLFLQETNQEPIENLQQKGIDIWSAQESSTNYKNTELCQTEDYIDAQFVEHNEWESLKEENRRLKVAAADTEFSPQLYEDIITLKDQLETSGKICERYEELLRIFSKQIGVPFQSLRKSKKLEKRFG